jgi:hypothetical protein
LRCPSLQGEGLETRSGTRRADSGQRRIALWTRGFSLTEDPETVGGR